MKFSLEMLTTLKGSDEEAVIFRFDGLTVWEVLESVSEELSAYCFDDILFSQFESGCRYTGICPVTGNQYSIRIKEQK